MILSNLEIQRALDDGRLVISPEPTPRTTAPNVKCPYQSTSVDLRLGDDISYLKDGLPFDINLQASGFARFFTPNSETRKLSAEQPFVLRPGRFALGTTLECVQLPIRSGEPCLAARIEGKSSYARCGLLIHVSAPIIHSGFEGTITLELCNLGPQGISLYPGMPICQLILEEVLGTPFRNDSQFQGQRAPGGVLQATR
jgi:dCTP deaminase